MGFPFDTKSLTLSNLEQAEFFLEFPNGLLVDGETFDSLEQARYAAFNTALEYNHPIIIRKRFNFFQKILTEETILPAFCNLCSHQK